MSEKLSFNQIQGFLLSNAETIIEKTGRNEKLTLEQVNGNFSYGFQPKVVKKAKDDNADSGDTISDLMNAFSTVSSIDFVTDIPDEVRVQLRPSYRIYKTLVFDQGRRMNLELKSSITGESTIQNPGVVLKNIEISNLGGNLEEINTNIEVTITLYATKLDHFFEKQYPGAIKNGRFSTPPEAQKIINQGISWVDLLKLNLQDLDLSQIEESMRQTNLANRETRRQVLSDIPLPYEYKEPEQRIVLEISYGDIQDIAGYSQEQMNYIRSLVASQKELLELSLVANEVNFNEDGTAELVIQFRGSHGTDILDRRQDLLYDAFVEDLTLQLQDEISILERIREKGGLRSQDVDPIRRLIRSHKTFDFFNFSRRIFEQFVTGQLSTVRAPATITVRTGRETQVQRELAISGGGEADEDVVAQLDNLIEDREEAQNTLAEYQSGLLIRGLYGPTLFAAEFTQQVELESGSDRGTLPFNFKEAPADDKKSRVYSVTPKARSITKFRKERFEYADNTAIMNSFDRFLFRESSPAGFAGEALFLETQRQIESRSSSTIEEEPIVTGHGSVDVDFVFFGDILEVALEVLSSNNRYGTQRKDFESKIEQLSEQIVRKEDTVLKSHIDGDFRKWLKFTYVRPFYSTLGIDLSLRLSDIIEDPFLSAQDKAERLTTINDTRRASSDRIKEVYQNIGEILMSDIVYTDPTDPANQIKINIADIPICIDKFVNWFNEKIKARSRSSLFLRDYLNQLLLFVRDILAERYNDSQIADREPPEPLVNRFFVRSSSYDFLVPLTDSEKSGANNEVQISDIRRLTTRLSQNSGLYTKPITIVSQSPSVSKPQRNENNRRQIDKNNNVPHIIFGDATNGILQQINFSKIDMPGVREARLLEGNRLYYGEDFKGPNILSERYNATLDLIGTTFFRPTSLYYLDPRPLELGYAKNVASPARLLGLGGYYIVIRVVQNLNFAGSATWTTTLETQWQSFGDKVGIGESATSLSDLKISSFNGRLALATDTEKEELPELPIVERPEAAQLVSGEEFRGIVETRAIEREAAEAAEELRVARQAFFGLPLSEVVD